MRSALQKSPIPENHVFQVCELVQPVFDPNWHFHSEYQLFMVIKGNGTRFIGDHVQGYNPGEITLTGPDLPHLWRSDTEVELSNPANWSEGLVVYFNEHLIGEELLKKEEALKMRQLLRESRRGLDVLGQTQVEVGKRLRQLTARDGFGMVIALLDILDMISQSREKESLASQGYSNTLKQGDTFRMNATYEYVMKNFRSEIRLEQMADLTNMSPTSFSRYFKTHANKTFSKFVSEIRIGHACKLLIDKQYNASQACYASGFQTLSNFNRQFRSLMKRSPSEYKREYLSTR